MQPAMKGVLLLMRMMVLSLLIGVLPCWSEDGGQVSEQEIEALLPRLVAGTARGGAPQVRELLDRTALRLSSFVDEERNRGRDCVSTVWLVSPASKTLFGDRYVLTSLAGRECSIILILGDDARGLKDARVETMGSNAQDYHVMVTFLRSTENGWQQPNEFPVMPRQVNAFPVAKDTVYQLTAPSVISGTTSQEMLDAARAVQCRPHLAEGRLSCSSERHLKLYRDVITNVHLGAPVGAETTVMVRTCLLPAGPAKEALAECSWLTGVDGRKTLLDARYTVDSITATKAQIIVLRKQKSGGVHFEQQEATLAGNLWIMKTINRYDRKPAKPEASP